MARITVEDCIKLINNQYDLVILAKERAVQLGRGATPAVDPENDKKPVIALREISESKITAEELKEIKTHVLFWNFQKLKEINW